MMSVISSGTGQAYKLEDVLDIVRNEDKYKARLKEINDVIKEANESTAKLTKAKDLDAALQNAKRSEQQAKLAREEALAKAAQVISEAESQGQQIVASANESITEIVSQVHEKQTELNALTAQASLLTKQIEALGEKYNDLVKDVRAKELEKQALLETITDKQRKLKELLNA